MRFVREGFVQLHWIRLRIVNLGLTHIRRLKTAD